MCLPHLWVGLHTLQRSSLYSAVFHQCVWAVCVCARCAVLWRSVFSMFDRDCAVSVTVARLGVFWRRPVLVWIVCFCLGGQHWLSCLLLCHHCSSVETPRPSPPHPSPLNDSYFASCVWSCIASKPALPHYHDQLFLGKLRCERFSCNNVFPWDVHFQASVCIPLLLVHWHPLICMQLPMILMLHELCNYSIFH